MREIASELMDLLGALVFRRRAIRRILDRSISLSGYGILAAILVAGLAMQRLALSVIPAQLTRSSIVMIVLMALLDSAFWIAMTFFGFEPLLNLLLRSATDDEAELHWWSHKRLQVRKAMFTTISLGLFLAGVLILVFSWNNVLFFIAIALSFIWNHLLMALVLRFGWNYPFAIAYVIASGILITVLATVFLMSFHWLICLLVLFILAAMAPWTMNDLLAWWQSHRLIHNVRERGKITFSELDDLLELLLLSPETGYVNTLKSEIAGGTIRSDIGLPAWAHVRLTSICGHFMEAIDAGLRAVERGEDNVGLHLAMAEACLSAGDPENAAAHAEEALDLAGGGAATVEGCEALLFHALASFNLWEVESAIAACRRALEFGHHQPTSKLKRILAEIRLISGRFSYRAQDVF